MWGLVICIKMFTNVYLNKVLFIPCEVISLHPRRLMLSESPAVGSVHGHRVGRAAQSGREWTGSAAGPRLRGHPPASSGPPGTRTRLLLRAPSAPSPRGRAGAAPGPELLRAQEEDGRPGCARIVDPAPLAGRASLIVVSPLSTWKKPRKQRMERNSLRDPRGPASPSAVVASECEM